MNLPGVEIGRALFVADRVSIPQQPGRTGQSLWEIPSGLGMGSVSEVKEEVLARAGRYRVIAENLQAKEVMVGDGDAGPLHPLLQSPGG